MDYATDIITLIAALSGALATVLLQQYFSGKNRKGKLAVIENRVTFSITSSDKKAKSQLANKGLGFYINMDLECQAGPVSFNDARLVIKRRNELYKLNCSLIEPKQFISMQTGDLASVMFIANPSPYGDYPQEIIRKFVGGVFSFAIVSTRKPNDEVLKLESKYVDEIKVPILADQFQINIPIQTDKAEAERIKDVLKANGVIGVEITKESELDLSNVTSIKAIGKA